MLHELAYDKNQVFDFVENYPTVSLVLPFEPKMSVHRDLENRLARVLKQVERHLAKNYAPETFEPLSNNVEALFNNIDFSSFKISVAIFVSPAACKIYYLDIPVQETVIIDEPFGMRDLVYSKTDDHKYLVLKIADQKSEIFTGSDDDFRRLLTTTSEHARPVIDVSKEQASGEPSPHPDKVGHFFQYVDQVLGHIYAAYEWPIFIIGTPELIQEFKTITQHGNRVVNYVGLADDRNTTNEIQEAVAPYVADWNKVKTKHIIQKLKIARNTNKLVAGIDEVLTQATGKRGRLLVVEDNYVFAEKNFQHHYLQNDTPGTTSFTRDAVDDAIEKVLENGGDVEFVEGGALKNYQRIALIME